MGGSKETSQQKTEYDPAYMARINQNYDNAKGIADLPFSPFDGERVAGFTDLQKQGQQGLLSAAMDPTAANTLNQAKQGILGAMGTAQGLFGYRPPSIMSPGNLNARNVTAPTVNAPGSLSARTLSAPMIGSPGTLSAPTIGAPNPVTAGTVNPTAVDAPWLRDTDLAPYMNPFQKNVIDATMTQLGQQRGQQEVADNASATAAHAFGGSRQGVQRALTAEGYDRNTGGILAGLNSDNFRQAQQGAMADISNRLNLGEFNAGQALDASKTNVGNRLSADTFNTGILADIAKTNAGYQFGADQFNIGNAFDLAKTNAGYQFGADQYNAGAGTEADKFNLGNAYDLAKTNAGYQFGADQYNANAGTAADQFNIGTGLDVARANAGNDIAGAGLRLNAASTSGALASQLGQMSNAELQQALQRAGVIEGVGGEQQAQQQTQDDAAYQEFLRQLDYPYQQQSLRNAALGMFPVQGTQTTTSTKSPGAMGIIGGILGGAQTAGALGWAPFSDVRTKANVRTEGYDRKGRRIVSFNYKWDDPSERKRGVIAQEIMASDPHAVIVDPATGFYRVDYSKLEAA